MVDTISVQGNENGHGQVIPNGMFTSRSIRFELHTAEAAIVSELPVRLALH